MHTARTQPKEFSIRLGKRVAASAHVPWVLLCLGLLALIGGLIIGQRSDVTLKFNVESQDAGNIQIYYSANGAYSEFDSHVWPLQANAGGDVSVGMPTSDAAHLRLDPAPGMRSLRFCKMRLRLSDGREITIPPAQLRETSQVQSVRDGSCVRLQSSSEATDPQAAIDLSAVIPVLLKQDKARSQVAAIWIVAGLCGLAAAILLIVRPANLRVFGVGLASFERAIPKIYLFAAIMVGTLFAVLTPPGAVPDEPAHIAKAIMVENGQWLGVADGEALNPSVSSVQGPFGDYLNPGRHFGSDVVFAHASTPLACTPSAEGFPASAASYSPTLYLAPAFVLNVACRNGASVGSFIYGGRLANLTVSILLTFIGITFAGGARWPLFAIALFPMTLFQQASMSADSMILGMSFCLMGLHAGLASGRIRPGSAIEVVLIVLGLLFAIAKPGTAWVCVGFIFSIQSYRAAQRSFWPRILLVVGLPWLAHILWMLATAPAAVPRATVDPAANLQAVLDQPTEVLALLWRTFFAEGGEFIWTSLVGRLGWLDVILHPVSYVLGGMIVLTTLVMRTGQFSTPVSLRLLAVPIAVGSAMLYVIPMYMYWTPKAALMIEGLQGRYFIASLAFLLIWVSLRAPVVVRAAGSVFIVAALLCVQLDAIYSVAHRYYG